MTTLTGFDWKDKRRQSSFLTIGFLFALALVAYRLPVHSDDGSGDEGSAFQSPLIWKYPLGEDTPIPTGRTVPGDLLTNGDMDQMGFYWRPPNHWIAGAWFEWFSTKPFNFPEFNDGFERGFFHTYPSSQRLQLWGDDYAAGLMQHATVNSCTNYRFQAYGHSRPSSTDPPPVPVESHMKVGIEPFGWMSGRSIYTYDPGLEPEEFPPTVVWSPEETHNFYFSPYTVTTEALSNTVTVILYSNPEVDIEGGVWWNDTVWDTASLVQVPPPSGTLLDGDLLPEPDGLITNLTTTVLPRGVIVEWDTGVEASTQLLYRVLEQADPITVTTPLSYSVHLPVVTTSINSAAFTQHSPPDQRPVYHHRTAVGGLPSDFIIEFVALSRRLEGKVCVTSASIVSRAAAVSEGYVIHIPALFGGE